MKAFTEEGHCHFCAGPCIFQNPDVHIILNTSYPYNRSPLRQRARWALQDLRYRWNWTAIFVWTAILLFGTILYTLALIKIVELVF